MVCGNCGLVNADNASVCDACSTAFLPALTSNNRLIAALLSFLIPGLGQAYLGRADALRWFVKTVIGYLLFVIPGLIFHALCVFDGISVPKAIPTSKG
jgi:TM2 domain-containing membrane protein YozV